MIGEALRLLRTLNDVKLTELAKEFGVSPSFLSEIENEKKKANLEIIERYSKRFEIRPSAILFFAEELDVNGKKSRVKSFAREKMLKLLRIVESGQVYASTASSSESEK